METNTIEALIHALAQKPVAPPDFWSQIMPYIIMLIIAVVAWIKANTIEHKADVAATAAKATDVKADAAIAKHDEVGKTVDKILIDVNSRSEKQDTRGDNLVALNKELSAKLAVLEERLRPLASAVGSTASGSIQPVLAVPASIVTPGSSVVPDVPTSEKTITLSESQFQQLLARK